MAGTPAKGNPLKILLSALMLVLTGLLMAEAPDEAFETLMDAFYEGDAYTVENHLSSTSLEMINMMLIMVKMQPDQAAAELSEGLQVPVSGEELVNWTATDFIDAMINSPAIRDDLPPREDIVVSGCDVQGDTGVVYLQVEDYPDAFPVAMVLEGDGWKLSQELIQSEF